MEALTEFEHPLGGTMRQPRPTGQFSHTRPELFRCSPKLGEHTDEVLQETGYTLDEINGFRDMGIVGGHV